MLVLAFNRVAKKITPHQRIFLVNIPCCVFFWIFSLETKNRKFFRIFSSTENENEWKKTRKKHAKKYHCSSFRVQVFSVSMTKNRIITFSFSGQRKNEVHALHLSVFVCVVWSIFFVNASVLCKHIIKHWKCFPTAKFH